MIRKYSVFLWPILILGSCSKTTNSSIPTGVDVYISGNNVPDTGLPKSWGRYWKNNEQFDLSTSTDGALGVQEYTTGIAVAGNDLYICGGGTGSRNAQGWLNFIAKYWKNGVSINLTDGSTIASATAIAIAGTDVYVTGYESPIDQQEVSGKYWKNGVGVNIPFGKPTGIAISGRDVYISGVSYDNITGHATAVYWKSGITVRLSDGSADAQANAILIYGSDIYVAGFDGNRAVYWKNQVPVYLTDGSTPVSVQSITVEGTDVLVAGKIGTNATYWKNGIPVTVGANIDLTGIAVAEGNIYVAGNIQRNCVCPSYAGYWINNERQTIFDSTANSFTSQILAVKH